MINLAAWEIRRKDCFSLSIIDFPKVYIVDKRHEKVDVVDDVNS